MKKELIFEEKSHSYVWGIKLISVTELIHRYDKPFEADRLAGFVAKRDKKTKEEVLKEWEENRDRAADLGTNVHSYAEAKTANPGKPIGAIKYPEEELLRPAVDSFFNDHPSLKPLFTEKIIYSLKYLIAGTVDFIAKDETDGKIYIIDWKTNKEIKTFSKYNDHMKLFLSELDSCNYNVYMLQLSMYRYFAETELGLKIAGQKLVHLTKGGYFVHDVPYKKEFIEKILKRRIIELACLEYPATMKTFIDELKLEITDSVKSIETIYQDDKILLGITDSFESFEEYFETDKTNVIFSKIVGTSFRGNDLTELSKEAQLTLKREPENQFDSNAIAIYSDVDHIGYIKKELAAELAPKMDKGTKITAKISEITGGTEDKKNIGINIRLVISEADK